MIGQFEGNTRDMSPEQTASIINQQNEIIQRMQAQLRTTTIVMPIKAFNELDGFRGMVEEIMEKVGPIFHQQYEIANGYGKEAREVSVNDFIHRLIDLHGNDVARHMILGEKNGLNVL